MAKQNRSAPVMQAVLDAVGERLMKADESLIRIPEICEATGVNYGSVYHHFGSREGVIDAAYHQMFTKLAEEDLATLQLVSVSAQTFEEYLVAMQGLIGTFASSDGAARPARPSRAHRRRLDDAPRTARTDRRDPVPAHERIADDRRIRPTARVAQSRPLGPRGRRLDPGPAGRSHAR